MSIICGISNYYEDNPQKSSYFWERRETLNTIDFSDVMGGAFYAAIQAGKGSNDFSPGLAAIRNKAPDKSYRVVYAVIIFLNASEDEINRKLTEIYEHQKSSGVV